MGWYLPREEGQLGDSNTKRGEFGRLAAVIPARPQRSSVLYPAHFRAILQPYCSRAYPIYAECAREAYKDYGCRLDLPPPCANDEPWLD
jgi:hypothetical protein